MISGQLSPECSSEIFAGSYSFVSRDGPRRGWLPKLGVLARRDDGRGSASGNYVVASARVIGPIGGDRGDLLIGGNLFQQVGQHGCITDVACRDTDRADLQCFFVHTEMKLAPQALLWAAVLARVPLPFTLGLDPGRINQQVQRPLASAIGDGDVECLLTAAQGAEVRHFPVQPGQSKQAFDEPSRLPEGHAEQDLHRQANLDRCVAELGLTPPLACRRRMPRHLGIKPDR